MENSSQHLALFPSAQHQKVREIYTSLMRPSQYMRPSENAETTRAHLERERISMEQVLLDRRWLFHWASPLFHFLHDQLSDYAHDLVKTLRTAALRACKQQFGYSVSIRSTETFIVFQIQEERDKRRKTKVEAPERSGGFVLYFPTAKEQRPPPKGRERQQVLLLTGNNELMRWVCSWLQRRFQCVVSTQVVHIEQIHFKRLARDWVVASLLIEDNRVESNQQEMNNQETQQGPTHAPLRLSYRATKDDDLVRVYTLTVPWATLRRLFQQTRNGPKSNPSSTFIPELIQLTERLYTESLPFDLTTYEIERVELEKVIVEHDGGIKFYSIDLVPTVLFSMLELLTVQNVATALRPEMTL